MGVTRTISLANWGSRLRRLASGGAWERIAERGLREAGMRAVNLLQERSDQLAFDVGHYKRGWQADARGPRLTIHNDQVYSGVIEDGRRPGSRMPPIDALVPWVKHKLDVVPYGPRQKGARAPNVNALLRSTAFRVALAIARRGIPGKHVLGGVLDTIEKFIVEEVDKALRSALNGEGGGE